MKDVVIQDKCYEVGTVTENELRSSLGQYIAKVYWTLEKDFRGYSFSASGSITHKRYTNNFLTFGQCLDRLLEIFPEDEKLQTIVKVWKEYNLNDLNAGLPIQEEAIKNWKLANNYTYDKACEYLKSIDLYEVNVTEEEKQLANFPEEVYDGKRGYRYGERWIYRAIPQNIVDEILSW